MLEWFDKMTNQKQRKKREVCANCRNTYIASDRYCRFCGAPMGKPDYIEERDRECIYGPPPVERAHKCEKCGYQWTTYKMIDEERCCPKCGGSAPIYTGDGIYLSLKYKGAKGWEYTSLLLPEGAEAIIGRSQECDFSVTDMCVSRKQFRLFMKDNNIYIENLGKTNPTRINGKPFNEIRQLKSGNKLDVSSVFFYIYFSLD